MSSKLYFKKKSLLALMYLGWGIYIFSSFPLKEPTISMDGVTYVHIAKNIIIDKSLGWQASWASPFFSILIALIYFFINNFVISAITVSKLTTFILPLFVYKLASHLYDKKIGITSAFLVAIHPHFIFNSNSMEPETLYTALLLISSFFYWKAWKNRTLIHAFWAGFFWSITYLTRSEGLLIFLFMSLYLFFLITAKKNYSNNVNNKNETLFNKNNVIGRNGYLTLIVVFIVFFATSFPYINFLKNIYGKYVLSPKSSYVQIWMKSRVYNDNELGEIMNPELWGISKDGKYLWQEPKGSGDLIEYLMSHPRKSLQVYLENFSQQIPGKIPNGSGQYFFPQIYPLYLVIPALYYLISSLRQRKNLDGTLYLLSVSPIFIVLPVFTGGWWKYLFPYTPFLIILASCGIVLFLRKLNYERYLNIILITIFIHSIWAVEASNKHISNNTNIADRERYTNEQKKVGNWAKNKLNGTHNYMIIWSKLAYYLDGRWTAMPLTNTYQDMVLFAKKKSVDYIVFEVTNKKDLQDILMLENANIGLAGAGIYESSVGDYWAIFFKTL